MLNTSSKMRAPSNLRESGGLRSARPPAPGRRSGLALLALAALTVSACGGGVGDDPFNLESNPQERLYVDCLNYCTGCCTADGNCLGGELVITDSGFSPYLRCNQSPDGGWLLPDGGS